MRSDTRGRVSQVECLECRTVLSSHPMGDFRLDYLTDDRTERAWPTGTAPLHADVDMQSALTSVRQIYGFQGTGQTVAVIDSGIAWDHMALGQGWGPGYRVVGGWDFTGENDPDPYDDGPFGSHGTHVAGIIGSNAAEQTGVAPDVDLVALRVFDDEGSGYFRWVEQALDWVHDNLQSFQHPITTVNLSLGTTTNSDAVPGWATLEDELAQLEADGVFVAVAAGNAFEQFQSPGLSYPASSQYVVPVMSADPSGDLSYFSQRHERAIAAPGRRITSSVPDYVGNQNGRQDDFAAYSGTSMATPYVAGSSVLVREAMELLGYADIDQDDIQAILMESADPLYDVETGRVYRRLDVAAALDSVMPDDDFGSSPANAWDMGALSGGTTLEGFVGALTDADYFSFTAAASGTVRFSAETSHDLQLAWHSPASAHSVDEHGRMSLEVELGQTYIVGVSTSDGLGYYSLSVELSKIPEFTDLGVVDFVHMDHSQGQGATWYRIETARDGLLTVDAASAGLSNDAELGLYDAGLNLVASSRANSNRWRVDVSTEGGDVYYLRLSTVDPGVDLRIFNLLQVTGDGVEVYGTPADDVFHVTYGQDLRLRINNIDYRLPSSLAHSLRLHGGGGLDAASVVAGPGANHAFIRDGQFELEGDEYTVQGDHFEQIRLYGHGKNNDVRMYGSTSADNLIMTSEHVRLAGGGLYAFVEGFASVRTYGMSGADAAFVFDSPSDDNYVAAPTHVRMAGEGYYRFAEGFEVTRAVASAGDDVAYLYDSNDDDTLVGYAQHVKFSGSLFNNTVQGFDRIVAYAAEGLDKAFFYITGGNRHGPADSSRLAEVGYIQYISGFDQTFVAGASGSGDAIDQDSSGSESYAMTANSTGPAASAGPLSTQAFAYPHVSAGATSGTAYLFGSTEYGVPAGTRLAGRVEAATDGHQARDTSHVRSRRAMGAEAARLRRAPSVPAPGRSSGREAVCGGEPLIDVVGFDIVVFDVWAAVPQGQPGPTQGLTLLDHLFEQMGRPL